MIPGLGCHSGHSRTSVRCHLPKSRFCTPLRSTAVRDFKGAWDWPILVALMLKRRCEVGSAR